MTKARSSSQIFLVRHTPVRVPAGTCYGSTNVPLDDAKFAHMLPDIHAQLPLHAAMVCSALSRCLHLAHERNDVDERSARDTGRLAQCR